MDPVKVAQMAAVGYKPVPLGTKSCVITYYDNNGDNGVDVSAYDLVEVYCEEDVFVAVDDSALEYDDTVAANDPAAKSAGNSWVYLGGHSHIHFKNVSVSSAVFLTGYVVR